MHILHSHFLPFIRRHHQLGAPLLIAASGGPDSMALLYLMLAYRKRSKAAFAVAHVDHGWREESREEAEGLEEICGRHQVPFHHSQLDPAVLRGNLEEACRKMRQQFFKHLCGERGYAAVLLGHHQDDQAETVLKRVFEGARLENCGAMTEVSQIDGIAYWRPLLHLRKQQLIAWLEEQKIPYFEDRSNSDCRFLRARLREKVLPDISRKYGKEVEPGLAFHGMEANALQAFMSFHVNKWLERRERGVFGTLLDLQGSAPTHLFEARYLITELFPCASREIAYSAAENLLSGAADKRYEMGGQVLYVDRKRLFAAERRMEVLPNVEIPLGQEGALGPWKYRVEKVSQPRRLKGWKQALRGFFQAPIDRGIEGCTIGIPLEGDPLRGKLRVNRARQRIPAFVRSWVPVVRSGERVVCDFLSEDRRDQACDSEFSITLYHKLLK